MRLFGLCLVLLAVLADSVTAAVVTLRDTTEIEDAVVYSFDDCSWSLSGESCRRFNSGGSAVLHVGADNILEHHTLMRFPGWDRTLPDSSALVLHCIGTIDQAVRRIFVYPLTRDFIEGTESYVDVGGIPMTDSGATWENAWLHAGINDSVPWTAPGGDYTTAVGCTAAVADTGQDVTIRSFNRILGWFDSTGQTPTVLIINENAFPGNTSDRTFVSSEGDSAQAPRLLLYYPDTVNNLRRRHCVGAAGRP